MNVFVNYNYNIKKYILCHNKNFPTQYVHILMHMQLCALHCTVTVCFSLQVSMVIGVVGSAAKGAGGGRVCGAVAALLALPALVHTLPRHTLLNIQDVRNKFT